MHQEIKLLQNHNAACFDCASQGYSTTRCKQEQRIFHYIWSCLNRWTLQDHPMVCIPYGGLDWAKAFRCDGLPGYCADCLPSI
ncbi:hypothetical protein ACLKA7_009142 [Drosophila subpalustris]